MKRVFVFSFGLLAILSLVAVSLVPAVATDGKIRLSWVCDDNPARRDQMALFNKLHPTLNVELDPTNNGMEKVIVQSLAGVGPDLFVGYDSTQLYSYVRSGIAWDLTDKLAASGIDMKKGLWSGPEVTYMIDDRVYGFPANAAADAIWLNKDMFEKAEVPLPKGPWKWADFIPLAQRMTIRDAGGRVQHFGFLLNWGAWAHFVIQMGGRIYTPDGTRCVADCPETIAAIQFMQDLVYKYRCAPSPTEEAAMATAGGWGTGTITLFGGGKGAMALGGRWWLCLLRDYKDLRMGAVESPFFDKRVFRGYGKSILVNKFSLRREEAFEFIKYMAGREYNELINHQADAVGPVREFCYTDKFLHDPAYPQEDYNEVWRTAMEFAVPEEFSPFINGYTAMRIINRQIDLVKADAKTPAEAMKAVARDMNAEIAKTVAEDPELRARYEALRKGAKP
jgi:ABC-type glycerol-3-phosphate transport system substrate-binding protein